MHATDWDKVQENAATVVTHARVTQASAKRCFRPGPGMEGIHKFVAFFRPDGSKLVLGLTKSEAELLGACLLVDDKSGPPLHVPGEA